MLHYTLPKSSRELWFTARVLTLIKDDWIPPEVGCDPVDAATSIFTNLSNKTYNSTAGEVINNPRCHQRPSPDPGLEVETPLELGLP